MTRFIWINIFDDDLEDEIKNLFIPLDCKFFIVKKIEKSRSEIIDVYQTHKSSSQFTSVFAIWENKNLNVYDNNFYFKRKDLKGHKMNIALSPVSSTSLGFSNADLLLGALDSCLRTADPGGCKLMYRQFNM